MESVPRGQREFRVFKSFDQLMDFGRPATRPSSRVRQAEVPASGYRPRLVSRDERVAGFAPLLPPVLRR